MPSFTARPCYLLYRTRPSGAVDVGAVPPCCRLGQQTNKGVILCTVRVVGSHTQTEGRVGMRAHPHGGGRHRQEVCEAPGNQGGEILDRGAEKCRPLR